MTTDRTAESQLLEDSGESEVEVVDRMVRAARALIDSLGPALVNRALWTPYNDPDVEAERTTWFYTPTDHGGVALNQLFPAQQRLVMRLLATGLTRQAYVAVSTIIGLENVLDELEGWTADWGRERGRDPGLYWLRIFGDPGEATWGWRFGGHHVSVNLLVRNGRIASTTPSFLGADPAISPLPEGEIRPLGGTEDLARELMNLLDAKQREAALLHPRAISDIVSGNRVQVRPGDQMIHMQDLFRGPQPTEELAALVDRIDEVAEAKSGYTAEDHEGMALQYHPQGLAAKDMNEQQRHLFRRLIAAHTDRSPTTVAKAHRSTYDRDSCLDDVFFGWAGDLDPGLPHYYRVTSERLLIEYDNTQRDANHAHSVWRDPIGDFGLDPLASHRSDCH